MRSDPPTDKKGPNTIVRKSASQHNGIISSLANKVYPPFIKQLAYTPLITSNSQETSVIQKKNLKVVKLLPKLACNL